MIKTIFSARLSNVLATSARSTARQSPIIQARLYSYGMSKGPSPPPLPKEDQEEFERLQRQANLSRAFQEYTEKDEAELDEDALRDGPKINAEAMKAQNLHPDFHYANIKPDFEGDTNPVTGEVGGPKQDPLRHGDYSFNARVTDF